MTPRYWILLGLAVVALVWLFSEVRLRRHVALYGKGSYPPPIEPIPMVLHCPACTEQHIDAPDLEPCKDGCQMAKDYGFNPYEGHACSGPCAYMQPGSPRWTNPPHRKHLCHHCGYLWKPANVATTGVQELSS